MKSKHLTQFMTRQYMLTQDYELYYFDDVLLNHVSSHSHDYYEVYFFLEGDVDYQVEDTVYHLSSGDFLIIPPYTRHNPVFKDVNNRFRRFILWLNQNFLHGLAESNPDLLYLFQQIREQRNYLLHVSDMVFQSVQARFIQILEEMKSSHICHDLEASLQVVSLLVSINRIVYDQQRNVTQPVSNDLHLNLCNYINTHLEHDLSLDKLSSAFYLSKYHISHVFKQQMGISIYQYILQKRLNAGKNCILSGIPISQIHLHCGFHNYSSFFRAFKKEFGVSPKEFQKAHLVPHGAEIGQYK